MATIPAGTPCFKCGEGLTKGIIQFKGEFYHSTCLVCEVCQTVLKRVREKDGNLYCEDDFQKLFGKKCIECQEYINGQVLEAGGNHYHPEHFICHDCKKVLGFQENFTWRDGKSICTSCIGLICASCNGVIMTGQYYKVSNQTGEPALFHHQCYSCSHCKVPLDNSVVTVYHENHLYCMTDFNQLFPDIIVKEAEQIQDEGEKKKENKEWKLTLKKSRSKHENISKSMESLRQSTENLSKSTESLKEKPEPPLEENPKQELEEPIQEQEQEPEKELIQEKEPEKEEEPLNDIPKEKVEEKIITPPQLEQEQQKIEDNRDSSFDSLEDSQIDIEMTTKIETFVPPEITFAGQQNDAPKKFKNTAQNQDEEFIIPWIITEANMSETEAELLLFEQNIERSFFVYRPETERAREFVLAFLEDENSPKHIRIKEREGKYYIKSEDGYFESIDALVKHYFSNPITKKGKTLDTPLDFHELKKKIDIPESVPDEVIDVYESYCQQSLYYNRLVKAAEKIEQVAPVGSDLHKAAKLCIQKGGAEGKLLYAMITSPFFVSTPDGIIDKFDEKDKFQDEVFFDAAVAIVDSKIAIHQAEVSKALAIDDDSTLVEIQEITFFNEEGNSQDVTLKSLIKEFWDQSGYPNSDGLVTEENLILLAQSVLPMRKGGIMEVFFRESPKLQRFKKRAKEQGGYGLDCFQTILDNLLYFPEHIRLFRKYAKQSPDFMTVLEFKSMLRNEQKIKNSERVLQFFYILTAGQKSPDLLKSQKIFGKHLTTNGQGALSLFGFINFLQSTENSIFNPLHDVVYQDMTRPLNHYFIESSHNSYLEGDQLKSASTAEAYKKILQSGCRCVELDLWDGPKNDPIIYHGYTLTSKVRARDVLETIAKFAFEASPYPLTLSLENHLSHAQQIVFAQYVREIFDQDIIPDYTVNFWETNPQHLPSPEQLKGKILIKNKAHSSRGQETNQDTKKHKVAKEVSDLVVYTKAVSFSTLEACIAKFKCYEMSSFGEKKAIKLFKLQMDQFTEFTSKFLARSYPDGKRFDSSNPDPQPFWNAGVQMVALNYQKPDRPMQLNEGRFMKNGRCGYTLKPEHLIESTPAPTSTPFTVTLKLLSGHCIMHPKLKEKFNVIVEVELSGLNPQVFVSNPESANMFGDILWPNEVYEFEVVSAELELLRFVVMDQNLGAKEIIGEFCLPIDSLQQGFRCVSLKVPQPFGKFETIDYSMLFVHVTISPGRPKLRSQFQSTDSGLNLEATEVQTVEVQESSKPSGLVHKRENSTDSLKNTLKPPGSPFGERAKFGMFRKSSRASSSDLIDKDALKQQQEREKQEKQEKKEKEKQEKKEKKEAKQSLKSSTASSYKNSLDSNSESGQKTPNGSSRSSSGSVRGFSMKRVSSFFESKS